MGGRHKEARRALHPAGRQEERGKFIVERETDWVVGTVGCNGIIIVILIITIIS